MEQYLSIKEVSRLLNIPEHTLRFWQEKGIFSVRREANNYRKYTVADLINIAEIAFYRNLGIPVRQMEHFSDFSLGDYEKILRETKTELKERINQYHSMYASLEKKTAHLATIETLRKLDFTYEKAPFSCIARFLYSDRDKLLRYTGNPSLYVRLIDTADLGREVRGIVVDGPSEEEEILWQKAGDPDFAVFLIQEYPQEGYVHNIASKLELVQKKHKTGVLLANFLMSETAAGRRVDYLKAYVQLL